MILIQLHTTMIILHLIAMTVGFGCAVAADYLILRGAVLKPVTSDLARTARLLGRMVTLGLVALWLTGAALVTEMHLAGKPILINEKLWAKVAIVCILTLNAFAIHGFILPRLEAQIGRRFFDGLPTRHRAMAVAAGAVSLTSWIFPLVLGCAREWNGVVPYGVILAGYASTLVVVAAAGLLLFLDWKALARGLPLPAFGTRGEREAQTREA
jgi:hypothetical protein